MEITYSETHDFTRGQLESLFLSVGWSSGAYPDKLVQAMKGFQTVISAWAGDQLIGMVCAMDDGVMNAYVHYLLVHPDYQDRAVGRTLMERIKEHYSDYLRICLIAYNDELHFYENCGFHKSDESSPMHLTSLWT